MSSFEEFSKSRLTTASEKPSIGEQLQELYDLLGNMRVKETDPDKKDTLSKGMRIVILIAAAIGIALVMW